MDANIYYGEDEYQKMMVKADDEKTRLTEDTHGNHRLD
jgi:hypothetical protein